LLDILIEKYSNIQSRYKFAPLAEKRNIIGSMYPENLRFDGTQHRTAYLSEPLSLILLINNELGSIKKGKTSVLRSFPLK
jgi:site-specific DNA recombinase